MDIIILLTLRESGISGLCMHFMFNDVINIYNWLK